MNRKDIQYRSIPSFDDVMGGQHPINGGGGNRTIPSFDDVMAGGVSATPEKKNGGVELSSGLPPINQPSALQSTLRKKPTDDFADYAQNLNATYDKLLGGWGGTPNFQQPAPAAPAGIAAPANDPNIIRTQGTPLQQKQLRDREEVNKIRKGDLNTIVDFTNRTIKALNAPTGRDYEEETAFKPKEGLAAWITDANLSQTPTTFNAVRDAKDEQERYQTDNAINDLQFKAEKAMNHSVSDEINTVEEVSGKKISDEETQVYGEKLRKAKADIGIQEPEGNYASDILKASYKPTESIEEIKSHTEPIEKHTKRQNIGDNYSDWKDKEEQYYENQKNTQWFKYKNEKAIQDAQTDYYSQKLNLLEQSPSVQQYIKASEQEKKALQNDPDIAEYLKALDQSNAHIVKKNEVLKKYPMIRQQALLDMMNEFHAERYMADIKGIASPQQSLTQKFTNAFFGSTIDGEDEIKAISQALGVSEDEVREQKDKVRIPSYVGEAGRGLMTTLGKQVQWVNRLVLPTNEAEVRNAQIENTLYHAPRALQLRSDNINAETVIRAGASQIGQFIAFAGEGYIGSELAGGLGTLGVRGVSALGEATGATARIAANAPKIGRILNLTGEFLAPAAAEETAISRVAQAGAKARELASTYMVGYTSSYEDAYKEAQQYSNDPDKWTWYARAVGFLNGISEMILPDIDLAKKAMAIKSMKQLLKNGAISFDTKTLLTSYLANVGKIIGQENLEEYIPVIGQALVQSGMFNYQTSTSDFFKQLWETTVQTTAGTLPIGLLGGRGATSHYTKSIIWEMAKSPEKQHQMIDNMRDRGDMPNDVANERKQMINTFTELYNKVKDQKDKNGHELTEAAKIDEMWNLFRMRYNEQQKEGTEPATHAGYDETIKAADSEIKKIIDGEHVESTEVTTTREELEKEKVEQESKLAAAEIGKREGDVLGNVFNDIFEEPEPQGQAATAAETQTAVEDDSIKIGDVIDKPVTYKGQKGRLNQDGQTLVVSIDGTNREYELGNVDEIRGTPIADFGVEHETSVVNVNDKGNLIVRGKEVVNNYSNPLAAINRDENGNIISVNLETADGKKRTFTGNVAEDIAYQIHLKEINKNNETTKEFENFINEDEQSAAEINNAGLSETSTEEAVGTTEQVSQQEQTVAAPESPYATIAADYLLNSGVGSMLSTDYLIQSLGGAFSKAGSLIESIRKKYSKQIGGNIKDFVNTESYKKIIAEIKTAIGQAYNNDPQAQNLLDQILQHPTGLPNKLGQEISIKLDNLNQPNATTTSPQAGQQKEKVAGSIQSDVNIAQPQQKRTEVQAPERRTDSGNRIETSKVPPTLEEKLAAVDDQADVEKSQAAREQVREKQAEIIEEETRGAPIPTINVTPATPESNTVSITQQEATDEVPEPTPSQAERKNVPGVFRFGEIQNIPIADINQSAAFRTNRKANENSVRFFRSTNSKEPVMVYRHSNGKIYILDGMAKLRAKIGARRKTVPVRFFNGTYEEAKQYAELMKPKPQGNVLKNRAARVVANDAQSFEEYVLQSIAGKILGGNKQGFSRADFASVTGFGSVNENRLSMAYGKVTGFNDIKDSVRYGILKKDGQGFDRYIEGWTSKSQKDDVSRFSNQDSISLWRELGEILLRYQTPEQAVARLEELQGINDMRLKDTAIEFHINEEQAVYIEQKKLNDVVNAIMANTGDIELTREEAQALDDIVRTNSNYDGSQMNTDAVYSDFIRSTDPNIISLRNKLAKYATTEEAISQSLRGTGSEVISGYENEEEPDPFSKGIGGEEGTALTPQQSQIVGNAFAKVFGKAAPQVIVDAQLMAEAFARSVAKFSRKLSVQAQNLQEQLNAAITDAEQARKELNSKRQQLDRSIQQDTQDLFGTRESESAAKLFNERVDPSARKKALQPFEERLAAAQKRVIDLQKQYEQLAKQIPQQQSLFSRIPIQRRVNAIADQLRGNDYGAEFNKMFEENPAAAVKYIAEQYQNEGTRQDAVKQFGRNIVEQANRLYPENESTDRVIFDARGLPLGMVENGVVYINPVIARPDTPFHEIGGHILTAWAKQNQPELYQKIIDVAKQAPEALVNSVRESYPELADNQNAFWEEVFSTFVGLDSRNIARTEEIIRMAETDLRGFAQMRQAAKELWNEFVNYLIDKGIFRPTESFNADDFREMTLSDFSNLVGEKLASGRRLSAPPYNLRQIREFRRLDAKYFINDNYGNPIDLTMAGHQQVADNIISQRRSDIRNNTFDTDPRFSRIGADANLTPHQRNNLDKAYIMEADGATPQAIFRATGWFRDTADNQMRYELPNDNIRFLPHQANSVINLWFQNTNITPEQVDKLHPNLTEVQKNQLRDIARTQSAPLELVLDYPEIFEAYPDMRSIAVSFIEMEENIGGAYLPWDDSIEMSKYLSPMDMFVSLRHEIQHAVQHREGFETGANLSVAEDYYNDKVKNLADTITQLETALAEVRREKPTEERQFHIDSLESHIRGKKAVLESIQGNKQTWIYFYYRNFAGEREAFEVADRGKIPDALRVITPPVMHSADSAITYGDNLAVKDFEDKKVENVSTLFHEMLQGHEIEFDEQGKVVTGDIGALRRSAKEEWQQQGVFYIGDDRAGDFNINGNVRYDKARQTRDQIARKWNDMQRGSDQATRYRQNMEMYNLLLKLAGTYVSNGVKNVSDYFGHPEFAKLFGEQRYEDLPQQIRNSVANTLQMSQQQRELVSRQLEQALKDGGDLKTNVQRRLNEIRQSMTQAQPETPAPAPAPQVAPAPVAPAAQEEPPKQKASTRWVANEETGKQENVPFTAEQIEAEKLMKEKVNEGVKISGSVKEYLSGATIEKRTGEKPKNPQQYDEVTLTQALMDGVDIIEVAKAAYGVNYATQMLDFIKNYQAPTKGTHPRIDDTVSMKALMYTSLENALAQEKIDNPENATKIGDMQDIVYGESQAYARQLGLGLGFLRLRDYQRYGGSMENASKRMFTSQQLKDRNVVDEAVQVTTEEVNNEADRQENNPPDEAAAAADAEATERKKAAAPTPRRKKSKKAAWAEKAKGSALLSERLAKLKKDIDDINC